MAEIPVEYTIQKPLRLETVNTGSEMDNVIVRGSDKELKEIPRSEFGSGGSEISGNPGNIPKFNSIGNGLDSSTISIVETDAVITSGILNDSGFRFNNLKNTEKYLNTTTITTPGTFPIRSAKNDNNSNIAIIYQTGNILDVLDKNGNTVYSVTLSNKPEDLVYDADNNLYVSVAGNSVTKIDNSSTVIDSFASTGGLQNLQFRNSKLFCYDALGNICFIDPETGVLTSYGMAHAGGLIAIGDSDIIYTASTTGIYKYDGTDITTFYVPSNPLDVLNIIYHSYTIYVLLFSAKKVISLDLDGNIISEIELTLPPVNIVFNGSGYPIIYSNNTPTFASEFTLIKPSGEKLLMASNVGTNMRGLYIDSNGSEEIYGISYSSRFWRKFIYEQKDFILALGDNGKVVGLDKNYFIKNEDLVTDNNTTVVLSASDLTFAYPDAINGFRVHCTYIISGALTYEKSNSGWIQYPVSAVTP